MSCDIYKKYELGEISRDEFLLHIKSCNDCNNNYRQDELLLQTAGDLNRDIETPDLWPQIKQTLQKESVSNSVNFIEYISEHKQYILRFAAILLIFVSVGFYLLQQPSPPVNYQSRILDRDALEDVIKKEQDYKAAISRLEKNASQKLAVIDENLLALYNNKIRVIDQQITRCQEALQNNPANTHIRKYLFAVLQDKKQTLEEILTLPI